MSFSHRSRMVNPRLGTYYGIFTAAFVSVAILVLVFEQLGVAENLLRLMMLLAPIGLYAAIGIASYTNDPADYYASGRRIPAFFCGINLTIAAIGATGLLSVGGAFLFAGFDALCLMLGGLAGFVIMAILLAPFIRKFGAFTLPTYLGRRFHSRLLRLAVAMVVAVPMMITFVAEVQLGSLAISELSGLSRALSIVVVATVLAVSLAAGGMRSLSWTTVAQSLATILALLTPVAIVAVWLTNIPVPQMSFGPVLREMLHNEPALAVPAPAAAFFQFGLPDVGLQNIAKRFSDAFSVVGPGAFFLAAVTVMTGFAASPWALQRVAATPGVYEARKSLGWATVLFGVLMLSLLAIAVFNRHYLVEFVLLPQGDGVPSPIQSLMDRGYLVLDDTSSRLAITKIGLSRDTTVYCLPLLAEFPNVFWLVAVAGGLAAALAAAGATGLALSHIVAEDVVQGMQWDPPGPKTRLLSARICFGAVLILGCLIALVAPGDPFRLWMWSLSIVGATLFPVLVLSIWWKRMNVLGALSGIAGGFITALLLILAAESGVVGIDSRIVGILGFPINVAALMTISVMTSRPSRRDLELLRDIRVPGGEILYDREMRKLRLKKRQRS